MDEFRFNRRAGKTTRVVRIHRTKITRKDTWLYMWDGQLTVQVRQCGMLRLNKRVDDIGYTRFREWMYQLAK